MKRIIFYLTSTIILASCSENKDSYNFVQKNIGTVPLDNVHVSFNGFKSAGGALYPGMTAYHQMVDKHGDIPEKVNVQWQRIKDGKNFNTTLKVKSELPQGHFHGDIIFLFNDDKVKLNWKKDL